MPLLVDTYNVLHVVGVLPPEIAGVDTAGLVDLIHGSRFRHERVTLVCDGTPVPGAPTGRAGAVTIRYAGGGVTADDLIARIIRQSTSPRRLTVISSDRAVAREARRRRCPTMRSEAFLRLIALDHRDREARARPRGRRSLPTGGLSDEQVGSWLAAFDIANADDVAAFMPPEPAPEPEPPPAPEPESSPAAPPDPPPAPPKPRPPVLPLDLVAEAARMVEEAAAQEPDLAPREEPDEVPATEPEAPAPPNVAAALASFLPAELIDDAEALARGGPAAPEETTLAESADAPREAQASRRAEARDSLLSDELIAEAEAMWRDEEEEEEESVGEQ